METSVLSNTKSESVSSISDESFEVTPSIEEASSIPNENFWIDSRYYVVKFLGEGAFGSVFLVYDNFIGQYRALKMAKNKYFEDVLKAEINAMQQLARGGDLDDKPITHILGHNIDQGVVTTNENEVITSNISYFITEYAEEGDLATHIVNNVDDYRIGIPEKKVFKIFEQLLDGIDAIHKKGFVHLDLKPDNILLMYHSTIVLSDFALAKSIKGEDGKGNFSKYKAGSKGYWSPEMFSSIPYNGQSSDLYSLGIILFIITFGSCPFQQANLEDTYFKLLVKSPVDFWK